MRQIYFLFILLITNLTFGQFQKTIISNTNTSGAYGILEKDINGDGILDLMGASAADNTVAYFINDGSGNFTTTIVDNNLTGASFVDAADFDGDGDMDFVATGSSDLVWYLNNNGTFVKTVIASGLNDPRQVRLYDIGTLLDPGTPDGDIDVGLLISGENTATVYINDGSNNFSRYNLISIDSPKYLHGGDFDGDSSADFLISSYGGNEVAWYKVGGFGLVRGGTVVSNFNGAYGVEGGDIDLDGDDDVIATAYLDNEVAWFENTDGTGTNFTKHTIDSNLPGASYIHWLDIDNDGDKDIVATGFGDASGNNSQVVIYYNDGAQNFTKTVIENTIKGAATFSVQDFDGDNANDVAVAGSVSNEFALLSQNPGAVENSDLNVLKVYPNPAYATLNITSRIKLDKVIIYDITGRKVLVTHQSTINVSDFNKGYYLVKIYLEDGSVTTKKVLVLR